MMNKFMEIAKEEAIWSVKMYFEPVTATFRFVKKLVKGKR